MGEEEDYLLDENELPFELQVNIIYQFDYTLTAGEKPKIKLTDRYFLKDIQLKSLMEPDFEKSNLVGEQIVGGLQKVGQKFFETTGLSELDIFKINTDKLDAEFSFIYKDSYENGKETRKEYQTLTFGQAYKWYLSLKRSIEWIEKKRIKIEAIMKKKQEKQQRLNTRVSLRGVNSDDEDYTQIDEEVQSDPEILRINTKDKLEPIFCDLVNVKIHENEASEKAQSSRNYLRKIVKTAINTFQQIANQIENALESIIEKERIVAVNRRMILVYDSNKINRCPQYFLIINWIRSIIKKGDKHHELFLVVNPNDLEELREEERK